MAVFFGKLQASFPLPDSGQCLCAPTRVGPISRHAIATEHAPRAHRPAMTTVDAASHCMHSFSHSHACHWHHPAQVGAACACCQPEICSPDGTARMRAAGNAYGSWAAPSAMAAQTPGSAPPSVWVTPEKEAAAHSRTTGRHAKMAKGKWPTSSAATLAAILRLLERSMSGACPVAEQQVGLTAFGHAHSACTPRRPMPSPRACDGALLPTLPTLSCPDRPYSHRSSTRSLCPTSRRARTWSTGCCQWGSCTRSTCSRP